MSGTRRWTDRDGRRWECSAYDHGPYCRRCRRVPKLTPHAASLVIKRLGWQQEIGRTDLGDYALRIWHGNQSAFYRSPNPHHFALLYDEAIVQLRALVVSSEVQK